MPLITLATIVFTMLKISFQLDLIEGLLRTILILSMVETMVPKVTSDQFWIF